MSAIASRTFTQAFNDVRGELRESGAGDRYTDSFLLPFGVSIHNDLQDEYAKNDRQFGETVVADATKFSYVAGDDHITVAAGVTDFYEPIELWQRVDTGSAWLPVNRRWRTDPPPPQNYGFLTDWEWSDGVFKVVPSSVAMLVMVRYQRQLAYQAAGSTMTVEGFYFPFVPGVCWKAARATKRFTEAADFKSEYLQRIEKSLLRSSRELQGISTRWGGYRPGGTRKTVVLIAQ